MAEERTIEYYMRKIHDLMVQYNALGESGETDGKTEHDAVQLLLQAREILQEALSLGHRNEELLELHVNLVINLSWYFFQQTLSVEEYTQSFIEPEEFVQRWSAEDSEGLLQLDEDQAQEYGISEETMRFLVEAGLPAEAAPGIAFLGEGQAGRLWEVWGLDEEETKYAQEEFSSYLLIGSDGGGSPVCIDTENNDIVVMLDHNYGFQAITFVNSSVQQLAESLLVYRALVDEAREHTGGEAALTGNVPADLLAQAEAEFLRIDSRALGRECFWRTGLDALKHPVE